MTRNAQKGSHGVGRLEDRLRVFAERHGISLTPDQRRRLEQLDRLVGEWNRALDLSGFRDADERVNRYFLEPLYASRWLPERSSRSGVALDVGSGGGSPVLPLALVRLGLRFTLLEPNRRRAVFLEEALIQLGLVGARVERGALFRLRSGGTFRRYYQPGACPWTGSLSSGWPAGWSPAGGCCSLPDVPEAKCYSVGGESFGRRRESPLRPTSRGGSSSSKSLQRGQLRRQIRKAGEIRLAEAGLDLDHLFSRSGRLRVGVLAGDDGRNGPRPGGAHRGGSRAGRGP